MNKRALTTLALLIFTLYCRAADYVGTLTRNGVNEPIWIDLDSTYNTATVYTTNIGTIRGSGKWTESRLVRTFSVMTATNQFVGTIKKGVVTGTFENYQTGEKGTFRCVP